QAAEQLQRWHEEGILGKDERGLNMAPDIAYALAWFAPDEKSFIDARLALYEKSAKDYVAAARALQLDPDSRQWDLTQLDRLVPILRQYKINHLIFSYTEHNRIPEVLSLFENDPQKQWTLVYRDGRTAIVSWDDPKNSSGPSRLTRARIADERMAFGPQTLPPLTARPAAPEARTWYERYLHPRQPRPLAGDEAGMHLQYFRIILPNHRRRGLEKWLNAQAASVVGSGALAPAAGEPVYRAILTDAVFE